jgi:hypothetical protein
MSTLDLTIGPTPLTILVEQAFHDIGQCIDTIGPRARTAKKPGIGLPNGKSTTIRTVSEVRADGTDWIANTLPRLEHVAHLPGNWDGRGSPGTDQRIVEAAVSLLTSLRHYGVCGVPVPFLCPIAGGSLQFEWTSGGKHIEIEFVDDKSIVFLKEERTPQGASMESDEIPLSRIGKIMQLLDWFAAP